MRAFRLIWIATAIAVAQAPLITAPVEKLAVKLRFRDWGPATVAGNTVLAGNITGKGGLFAIDATTGKQKWAFTPLNLPAGADTTGRPVVAGNVAIASFGSTGTGAVIGVSLATGKELWRGPNPLVHAGPALAGDVVYVLAKGGAVVALDAGSGKERWKVQYKDGAGCATAPVIRDGVVYFPARVEDRVMFLALDAKTGDEKWRYRSEAPYAYNGVCLANPVVTEDTVYAAGEQRLYAIRRDTGKDRFAPVEIRRPVDGRDRAVDLFGLVDAGSMLIGMTEKLLIAFDKTNGRMLWELPGEFREASPSTAVAGNVLYFQGVLPGDAKRGTLHALDLNTRKVLWTYTRDTEDPAWSFGDVTPVERGLWTDTYGVLLKLE